MDNITFTAMNASLPTNESASTLVLSDSTTWLPMVAETVTSAIVSPIVTSVQHIVTNVSDVNSTASDAVREVMQQDLSMDVFQLNLTWSELEVLLKGHAPAIDNGGQRSVPDVHALAYVIAIVFFYTSVLMAVIAMHIRKRHNNFEEEHYAALLNREEMAQKERRFRIKLNILNMRGLRDAPLIDQIPVQTV